MSAVMVLSSDDCDTTFIHPGYPEFCFITQTDPWTFVSSSATTRLSIKFLASLGHCKVKDRWAVSMERLPNPDYAFYFQMKGLD